MQSRLWKVGRQLQECCHAWDWFAIVALIDFLLLSLEAAPGAASA